MTERHAKLKHELARILLPLLPSPRRRQGVINELWDAAISYRDADFAVHALAEAVRVNLSNIEGTRH